LVAKGVRTFFGDSSRLVQVGGQREAAVLGLKPVSGRGTAILDVIPRARCPCHDGHIERMGYLYGPGAVENAGNCLVTARRN